MADVRSPAKSDIDPGFIIGRGDPNIDPGFRMPGAALPPRTEGGVPLFSTPVSHRRSLLDIPSRPSDGGSGMVHVQSYEQNRDGQSVHVSDYERRRPGTASGAGVPGGRGEPSSLPLIANSGAVKADAVPEKQPPDLHPHVTLEFDGRELRAIEDGEVVRRWPAVSGRPGFQGPEHQGEVDKGPLPEGDWTLRQSERQDIKNLSTWERAKSALGGGKWRGLENSWGNTRVWLEPGEGTDTKGRSGFSVHGGADPGSAGCIDLTAHMDDFAEYFSGLGKDVSIRGRYPE